MALAALASLGTGFSAGRGGNGDRLQFKPVSPAGPETSEQEADRLERRRVATERQEMLRIERAERKAKWDAIYNPTYATEPRRSDFVSRQTYRAALRKFQSSKVGE